MNNEEIGQLFSTILQGQKELQITQVYLAQKINKTNETVNNLANTVNILAQVTQNYQVSIQRITGKGLVRDADLSFNNQCFIRIEQRLERIENLLKSEE